MLCIPRLVESVLSGVSTTVGQNIFVFEALLPVALRLQKDPVADCSDVSGSCGR